MPPELAAADGALGFCQTRGQRCWVHKTANVLNKLPKSQQPEAKRNLEGRDQEDALVAFDAFVETGHQIRQGGSVPDQGSRRVASFLRLTGRTLETSAHDG